MAINKNTNNDEGTPMSKKEIRRTKRQMREINRGREEMGGEPLYSKEERRSVGKYVEPSKSIPMTPTAKDESFYDEDEGIVVYKGKSSKGEDILTYGKNRSPLFENEDYGEYYYRKKVKGTEPSEPDYEYKLYEPGGLGVPARETTQSLDKDQFDAVTGDNIVKANQVSNEIKNSAIANNNLSFQEKENQIKTGETVTNIIENETKDTDATTNNIATNTTTITQPQPGDGSTVSRTMEGASNQPNVLNEPWTLSEIPGQDFTPTSRDDIYRQASQVKRQIPQLAIEKLGVQDYYPEVGRDIAVGTFTGSRIGSQTIYSGAGGLLPLGLYDARKRAIAAEIKKKQAILDQIKDIPNIAKQFKTEFSSLYMDFLTPWLDAYKDKPEMLLQNADFIRDMNHYKSVGENFLKVDSDLRSFKKLLEPKDGEPAAWATPAMLEIQRKFLSGFLPGKTEDWLTGKKNISKLTETVQAIPNGYKWMDKQIATLLSKGQVERTVNPKTGEDIDWTKAAEQIDGITQQLKDGSTDYETYLTVVRKYFDIDTRSMAEEWVKGNSLGALTDKEKEELVNSLDRYGIAQIPEPSFISTVSRQANDNASRYATDVQAATTRRGQDMEMEKFNKSMQDHNSIGRALAEMNQEDPKNYSVSISSTSNTEGQSLDKIVLKVKNKNTGQIEEVVASKIKANPGLYLGRDNKPIQIKANEIYYKPDAINIDSKANVGYTTGVPYTSTVIDQATQRITGAQSLNVWGARTVGKSLYDKNGNVSPEWAAESNGYQGMNATDVYRNIYTGGAKKAENKTNIIRKSNSGN